MGTALLLAVVTAANMLCWFLFQGYVVAAGGVNSESDALFASLALPQLLAMIANSSLIHVLVPFFAEEPKEQVRRDAHTLLLLLLLLFGSLGIVLYIGAPLLAQLLVPGFDIAARRISVSLIRINLLAMVFSALSGVLMAVCHAERRFLRAEAAPLLATASALALLPGVFSAHGVTGAAWLNVGRSALIVGLGAGVIGWPNGWSFAAVAPVWARVKPLLASSAYYKSDQLLDRLLASMGPPGALSVFHFAQQGYLALNAVLGKAIAGPAVPRLAAYWKAGNVVAFTVLVRARLRLIFLVSVGAWALLGLAGAPILNWLLTLHPVPGVEAARLWYLLLLLGGILVGGLPGLVLSEAFFAMGNAGTPALVTSAAFTLGIGAKCAGFLVAGLSGLALGTTLYFFAYPLVLWLLLERALTHLQPASEAAT